VNDDQGTERAEMEALLDRIEDIILKGELPRNLAGDLMSQSLEKFYDKLSSRLEAIQSTLRSRRRSPALLALVESKPIEQAFDEFKKGK